MSTATVLIYGAYVMLLLGVVFGVVWFTGAMSASVWPRSVNDPDPKTTARFGWTALAFGAASLMLGAAHLIAAVAS